MIQPVILCGGSGTRLWPLSTQKTPKQFIPLKGKGTLLEETIRRVALVMKECEQIGYTTRAPLLIMHADHKLPCELMVHEPNVVYEPYANDTAVAVCRASLEVKRRYGDENPLMLILPADHYIEDVSAFVHDIIEGIKQGNQDNIVLYGITASSPETKYGYIIPRSPVSFREKPDAVTALKLIDQGALWNSGIFALHVDLAVKCLSQTKYNIMDWVHNARDGKAPSFDVAVLQEYPHIYAHHCFNWKWSDVGSWESFMLIPEVKERMETATNNILVNCTSVNVLNHGAANVVVIGCHNLSVITTGDNVLIMPNNGDFNNELKEVATKLNR